MLRAFICALVVRKYVYYKHLRPNRMCVVITQCDIINFDLFMESPPHPRTPARFQAQANVFKDWIQMKAFRNTLQLNNYEIQDVFLFRRSLILLWWYDFIVMWTSEPLPFNTDQSGAVKKLNKFQYFALNNIHKQMKKTWNALEFTGTKWEGLKILLMQSNTRCIGWFEHLNFKKHYFQMT